MIPTQAILVIKPSRNGSLHFFKWAVWPVVVLLCGVYTNVAWAQVAQLMGNELKDIKASRNGEDTVLSFTLNKAWQGVVPSFLLANPARLVLDLPKTSNEIIKSTVDLSIGDTRRPICRLGIIVSTSP